MKLKTRLKIDRRGQFVDVGVAPCSCFCFFGVRVDGPAVVAAVNPVVRMQKSLLLWFASVSYRHCSYAILSLSTVL